MVAHSIDIFVCFSVILMWISWEAKQKSITCYFYPYRQSKRFSSLFPLCTLLANRLNILQVRD